LRIESQYASVRWAIGASVSAVVAYASVLAISKLVWLPFSLREDNGLALLRLSQVFLHIILASFFFLGRSAGLVAQFHRDCFRLIYTLIRSGFRSVRSLSKLF
jgi:hypothetical protein